MSSFERQCVNCRATNSPDATICYACGKPLFEGGIPVVKRRSSKTTWSIVGAILFVLLFYPISLGVSAFVTFLEGMKAHNQPLMASADKQVLAIGLNDGGNGAMLDPALPVGTSDQQLLVLLYSGLTTVNGKNQLAPGLAQSWDAQPDGQGFDWTFHLRPNLKFSNGSPLTSADVAYSIDRVFNSPNSGYGYLARYFKDGGGRLQGKPQTLIGDSLITPDPATITIKAQGRLAFLPAVMSMPSFLVVNRTLIAKYGGTDFTKHLDEGGSSGLYMQVGGVKASGLELAPNPTYYGSQPQLKKISIQLFSDDKAAHTAYQANRIAIVQNLDYDTLTKDEQSNWQVVSLAETGYYAMNYLTRPFDNIKIRQAFDLALDKPAIMDGAYKASDTATNHIIPQGQPGYNPSLLGPAGVSSPHGDPALAKKLLQQGMQEEGIQSIQQFPAITFTYFSGGGVSIQDEVKLAQSRWKSILDINVKLDDLPGQQFNAKITGTINNPNGLQFWRTSWVADYPDPQDWTSLQFNQDFGADWVNYGQNKSSENLVQQQTQLALRQADGMQDPQKRIWAYQQAEQQLVSDVAWLPLYQNNRSALVKPNLRGYQMNESGIAPPDVIQSVYIVQ